MEREREGEGTKFTIDRKIFSSDIWFDSPWKLKVWIYLIGSANHTDGRFMGVNIKRGETCRSLRTIRKDVGYKIGYRWKYPSISTIRRIYEDLMKDARINTRTEHGVRITTICNYNTMQPLGKQRTEQRSKRQPNNSRTTAEHNKNDKNEKNERIKNIPVNFSLDDGMISYAKNKGVTIGVAGVFEDFVLYHRKKGSKFADWNAAWQTWVRNQVKWHGKSDVPEITTAEDVEAKING